MEQTKHIIDRVSIERNNTRAKESIDAILQRADKVRNDPDKKDRLTKSLCKSCYYIYTQRVGGAAMTTRPCGICDKQMHFNSTCTDVICLDCGTNNELCAHCGADLELKNRRKPRHYEISK